MVEHLVSLETDEPVPPTTCVCCGAEADERYAPEPPGRMQGMPPREAPLAFPYCAACKAHLKEAQNRRTTRLVAVNVAIWGVAIPLVSAFHVASLAIGPIAAAYLLTRSRRLASLTPECTAEGPAVRVVWYRKHTYHYFFAREASAAEFRELNRAEATDR